MSWIESIQKAINFMEDHLLENITIEQIAQEVNSSVFHFQRTFAILTDMSIADYLRRRRLTLAAQELMDTDQKIIDLAYKYGYETPEAFTKAFRKQHYVTPSEARKRQGPLKSYNRLVIQVSLKGAEPMKYKIVEKDKFQVVGVKRTYNCQDGENTREIPLFWQEINESGFDHQLYQLNNGNINGVLGVCVPNTNQGQQGFIDYWIATNHVGDVGEDLLTMEVPASKWVVFEVHGPMPDAMQNTWKQIYSEWFPSNPYEPAGTAELEVYPEEDAYSPDSYSEIWIPIK
ncbi:effector binding domain-containing protein [Lysinibacillus sp. fkY74-1]|uniref:Transcriptional regulator, AraC/XylS family n=3 Tax=Lysinibacillus TaxID=400634 RepID=B1HRP5_LYSSC|nr:MULTISPECIES: AraC family transcriptional regulator [Lysinibacillus]MBE5085311.1 AraC family transcriptional regulator [Bacillus thuringiensis]ACA39330.1 transcriptional regulator, AraC/XylS family [Lysinibacillus sphaericus C3-41]AMO34472.1 AraC family transcriptional regulator [Lysinibacillus sphaericus]AMR90415.1 AraC family transcriptional regulator [Lysinibacillus sphaericus]ANA44464.1 AraC family transcriptional regulator [Lysinibacillus sphaericus]